MQMGEQWRVELTVVTKLSFAFKESHYTALDAVLCQWYIILWLLSQEKL